MRIQVIDRYFEPFITRSNIDARVQAMGSEISKDYTGLNPLFLGILNGSFIFAADLFRAVSVSAEISFIKLASYKGTSSTGNVVTAIGLEERITDRHIIIVEDIIDTGKTLHHFIPEIIQRNPASVKIASFLSKPAALQYADVRANYLGFEIANQFVVGYGLDYDGIGRNLPDVYQLVDQ